MSWISLFEDTVYAHVRHYHLISAFSGKPSVYMQLYLRLQVERRAEKKCIFMIFEDT